MGNEPDIFQPGAIISFRYGNEEKPFIAICLDRTGNGTYETGNKISPSSGWGGEEARFFVPAMCRSSSASWHADGIRSLSLRMIGDAEKAKGIPLVQRNAMRKVLKNYQELVSIQKQMEVLEHQASQIRCSRETGDAIRQAMGLGADPQEALSSSKLGKATKKEDKEACLSADLRDGKLELHLHRTFFRGEISEDDMPKLAKKLWKLERPDKKKDFETYLDYSGEHDHVSFNIRAAYPVPKRAAKDTEALTEFLDGKMKSYTR